MNSERSMVETATAIICNHCRMPLEDPRDLVYDEDGEPDLCVDCSQGALVLWDETP